MGPLLFLGDTPQDYKRPSKKGTSRKRNKKRDKQDEKAIYVHNYTKIREEGCGQEDTVRSHFYPTMIAAKSPAPV